MRIAMLTPLPPTRTGVAHYASMLLPALRQQVDVEAFASVDRYRRDDFDAAVYQLGNNPHHELVYREAMAHPGVAVLHDLVLHHLVVEMTLARGDVEGYVEALRANHGEAGAAWARGRAAGLHSEMGNFLLPASVEVANRSRAVIVHNRWAASRLESLGVTTPIHVVPHPYVAATYPDRDAVRARLQIAPGARVIGLFGFLTSAKRSDIVLRAFAGARLRDPRLQLLVVGEPAPNIDTASLAAEGVTFTGYVDEVDFAACYAAVDRLVNLRYPSAGESSGTLIRAFDAGKPVAVSDYAQFAELPDDCVTKIAFGDGEADALGDFFTAPLDEIAIARAQRAWLESNARLDLTVAGYLRALAPGQPHKAHGVTRTVPLFPTLALVGVERDPLAITIRNDGDFTLRTRTYGQPGYRLIVKLFDGGAETYDRWVQLPGDLAPGASTRIALPVPGRGELALFHAIEGIPKLEPEAWARAAL
ncbi:MAG: glycosyl transferase, group 1 [Acidobacteria bacterium]|nr:glycosyl transferase, group 1 [Acidobacteriota bacterium]